ncbi:F-box domain-containing protein [Hirsutella rhossiliensis]|uniref:F-box domain-containing protein n=1 Tax=Hirsutella rhossiliensis TaxID=111463 RepID=A0A9P8N2Z5_9HYPO|nr:f-box domain-containing protein [Hirsutella rhossiliensis]KAH0964904.1 f-box domain-containing protein [Hirsutella rhossiliensis]
MAAATPATAGPRSDSTSPCPASSSSPSSAPRPSPPPKQVQDRLPIIPTSATTSPANYGRINAENENNLSLLQSLPDHRVKHQRIAMLPPPIMSGESAFAGTATRPLDALQEEFASRHKRIQLEKSRLPSRSSPRATPLTALPPELIDHILSHLSARDLVTLSATSRVTRKHAISDFHWQRCVQDNVPGQVVTKAGPCATYRQLYVAHDLFWFLPRYKIWFCDRELMGKLVLVRFDQRRGCIEGYQLLAVSNRTTFEHWPADPQVIVHGFEPQVKLHLDKPVLQFRVRDRQDHGGVPSRPGANRFADEVSMELDDPSGAMFSNFLLTRALDPETADGRLSAGYPYDNVWPPPAVPARHHVSGTRSRQDVMDLSPDNRPWSRAEVSDQTFSIRHWMEMMGTPAPRGLMGQAGARVITGLRNVDADALGRPGSTRVHIGEEIITYSTLDPVLYTPTPTKPWRGIWVGDYSGHGCEFLLIHQPDDSPATDAELGLVRGEQETDAAWQQRKLDARIHRGRLEAIKLTGDPNVPRGEYTFVADDLGPGGYVGVATDAPFVGARVVRSKGHVAATGFVDDKYIESQLLLISPNRLAQYWVGFGHISFFERVQMDEFMAP